MSLEASSAWGEASVRWTIRLALIVYFLAVHLYCVGRSPAARSACRWCWTASWLIYVVHVALAFHVYHHWSHDHAFAHTEAVSGWGGGLFVSYAFTLVWGLTVLWSWHPTGELSHVRFMFKALIHAFIFFIVFNGAVIFATGAVRWVSLGACVFLAVEGIWVVLDQKEARSSQ